MRRLLTLAALLALGACVAPSAPAPPPAAPTPPPPPRPAPAPPPLDWQDRPLSPGDWNYGNREARFGDAVTLRCDVAAQRMTIEIAGATEGPLIVRTSYGDASRTAPSGKAELATTDPLLEQIAFSRGRFMLSAGGRELILPVWAEVARVVEDCR